MAAERIITSRRVLTERGLAPASIVIQNGVVQAVEPYRASAGDSHLDVGNAVVMPGLVDSHVHINEPGHADWEGFSTASRAAAAGGVTTLIDMPLNSVPVTTNVTALREKRAAAEGRCHVDHGFWGGVIPGNAGDLEMLWRAGVLGFKCFLIDSGLSEFPPVTEGDLEEAMSILAGLGAVLLAHAECPRPIEEAAIDAPRSTRRYSEYLASRPRAAEAEAIDLLIDLSARTGCAVHVVHLSDAESLPKLATARQAGIPLTVETCPHYLVLAAEDIPDGATLFKCAPPIRERENREGLWRGLGEGVIDFIASDHSPCPPGMKHLGSGNWMAAWGGISSLGLTLPLIWTEMHSRRLEFTDLAEWLCRRPARLAGLEGRKGRIDAGYDADLVVWSPESEFRVERSGLSFRHPFSPYEGAVLRGRVEQTLVRGNVVFDGHGFAEEAHGRWLEREHHDRA